MTDLFNTPAQTQDNEPESFLEELVGEGKKYVDQEALAKGAYHKDLHIQRLEQENENMRQDLQKRLTIEEFLEQSRQVEANSNERDEGNTIPNNNDNRNQFDPDRFKNDLLSEVNNIFNQQKKLTQAQQNVQTISTKLEEVWGKNYSQRLNQKAEELNLSKEFLSELAETNPKGFLSIVLGTQQHNIDVSPPKSSMRVDTSKNSGERTQSYYSNLRKTNPKLYYTKEVQLQEYKDAMRLRDRFFDN